MNTFIPFLSIFCIACSAFAYDVQIASRPALDAGPNTFIPPSKDEGTTLIEWLGGKDAIQKILIGAPELISDIPVYSEKNVRSLFEHSRLVTTQQHKDIFKNQYTEGTIYFTDGKKMNFIVTLSGVVIANHVFSDKAEQGAAANP